MSQFDWVIPVPNQEEILSQVPNQEENLSQIKVTNQFTSKNYEEGDKQISEDEESFFGECVTDIFFTIKYLNHSSKLKNKSVKQKEFEDKIQLLNEQCDYIGFFIKKSREYIRYYDEIFINLKNIPQLKKNNDYEIDENSLRYFLLKLGERTRKNNQTDNAELTVKSLKEIFRDQESISWKDNFISSVNKVVNSLEHGNYSRARAGYRNIYKHLGSYYSNLYKLVTKFFLFKTKPNTIIEDRFDFVFRYSENLKQLNEVLKNERAEQQNRLVETLKNIMDCKGSLDSGSTDDLKDKLNNIVKKYAPKKFYSIYFGGNGGNAGNGGSGGSGGNGGNGGRCFGILVYNNCEKPLAAFSGIYDENYQNNQSTPIKDFFKDNTTSFRNQINKIVAQPSFSNCFELARIDDDVLFAYQESYSWKKTELRKVRDSLDNNQTGPESLKSLRRMYSCVERKLVAHANRSQKKGISNQPWNIVARFSPCEICIDTMNYYISTGIRLFFMSKPIGTVKNIGKVKHIDRFKDLAKNISKWNSNKSKIVFSI